MAPTPYGTGAGHVSPNFNKWLETGTMSRTANRKLTKLYCPSQKRSPKPLIALVCRAKKVKKHDKKISGASYRTCAPLLNVFRRHCRAANLTTATDGQRSCYSTEPNIRLRRFVDEIFDHVGHYSVITMHYHHRHQYLLNRVHVHYKYCCKQLF